MCLPVISHSPGGGQVTITERLRLPVISHSSGGGQVTITKSVSSSDFTFTRGWPGHNYGEFVFQWFHIHQEVARSQLRSVSSSDFTFTRRWPGHNYGECVFQWFHINQEVARSHLRRVCLPVISHSPGGGQVTFTENLSFYDYTLKKYIA